MHLHPRPSYRMLPITALLIFGSSCSGGETLVDGRSHKLTNATNDAPVPSPRGPAAKTHSPIQLLTSPGASCTLSGDGINRPIPIWADELGRVRFAAVRALSTDAVRNLSLSCTDDAGQARQYAVDLTSDSTFQSPPSVPIPSTAYIRPALSGDPMQYSWVDLLHQGYGSRPNPTENPREYARWLKAVSTPALRSSTMHPAPGGNGNSTFWTGGELTNAGTYQEAYGSMSAPAMQSTTSGCTSASFWVGIGGGPNNDLIQTGVELFSQGSTVTTSTWLEYFSGNNVGGLGYQFAFSLFYVNAGDDIFMDVWACDNAGNINATGGYGCFWVDDETSGQYADCYLPNGGLWSSNAFDCKAAPCQSNNNSCHSLKQINTFVGAQAEAIIENNSPSYCGTGTWAHFGPNSESNITLTADMTTGSGHNYTTDSTVALTMVNGSGTAMDEVAIDDASPDGTSFYWERGN
jgi:hypothetical protein